MVRLFFAILALCLTASLAGPAKAQMLEPDTERPGATYMRGVIGMAGPEACWQLCAREKNCKAWTWQRPGIAGPQAVCQLKAAVMPGQKSPCCVSGLSNRLEQKIELAFARPRTVSTTMTPKSVRPVVSAGKPGRNYPISAPRPPVQRNAPMTASPAHKQQSRISAPQQPTAAPNPAPAYASTRILGNAPVKPVPVTGPRRDANGVPYYSVRRDFQAAPSKVADTPRPASKPVAPKAPVRKKPARPTQQANTKLPAGALQLLGD